MICCYLLHSKRFSTAEDALNFYGQQRTQDRKGVTIPSQLRYVNYYSRIVREQLIYQPISVYIREIILEPPPCFTGGQGILCFSVSQQTLTEGGKPKCMKLFKSENYEVRADVHLFDVCQLFVCVLLGEEGITWCDNQPGFLSTINWRYQNGIFPEIEIKEGAAISVLV